MSKASSNKRPAIFIDVDGTLVKWSKRGEGYRARLNTQLVERLKAEGDGADLVLWSRRGRIYAQGMADKFGVADLFCAIIGKPTSIIDDERLDWLKGVSVNE